MFVESIPQTCNAKSPCALLVPKSKSPASLRTRVIDWRYVASALARCRPSRLCRQFEKPGRRADFDYPEMAPEAVTKALTDAGAQYTAVEQAYVGYVYGEEIGTDQMTLLNGNGRNCTYRYDTCLILRSCSFAW